MKRIHWINPVSADFDTAADWSGHVVPGASDKAILDAAGSAFTVTASVSETVHSIQLAANATLDITGGTTFTASDGTGPGQNAGKIVVGNGATFTVGGNLNNTGLILVNGDVPTTKLVLASNTTLSGGGTVTLDLGESNHNKIEVEAATGVGTVTLTNVDNTIVGVGDIGATNSGSQSLTLVNQSKGVIEGGVGDGVLSFGDANTRSFITNTGILEAGGNYNNAYLYIYNTDIKGVGGEIVGDSQASVELFDCAVTGQTLETEAIGNINIYQGSSVTSGGNIENAGAIVVAGSNLTFDTGGTLSGGGGIYVSGEDGVGAVISGTSPAIVLTNVDNTIYGSGALGDGKLGLVNEAGGTIDADIRGQALIIDTGSNTIINDGLIETTPYDFRAAGGSLVIRSAIANNGVLAANDTNLVVDGAVTGSGEVTIGSGVLTFQSSFDQNVTFTGEGILVLAQSQAYGADITGFAAVDLRDVGFVSPGEASFSGTTSSGVLTVTDGTHTAHINLIGDYVGSHFVASSDGYGGVTVVDAQSDANPHRFAAAMASLGASGGATVQTVDGWLVRPTLLASPHVMVA